MNLIEDLKSARAQLISRGRGIGSVLGEGGRVCLVGAVIAATAPELLTYHTAAWVANDVPRARAVVAELHKHLPSQYTGPEATFGLEEYQLADFNDDGSQLDEDVLNLFDKALADLGALATA